MSFACACHMCGANATLTFGVMEALCEEVEILERKGKTQPIARRSFVDGVIRIDFTPLVQDLEINPESGFPAMLLTLGSLVVVAASWP